MLPHVKSLECSFAWWKTLWFQHTIPKHSFIGWLAIKSKLQSYRLLKWGYTGTGSVCFVEADLRVGIIYSLSVLSLKEFGVLLLNFVLFFMLITAGTALWIGVKKDLKDVMSELYYASWLGGLQFIIFDFKGMLLSTLAAYG